MLFYLPAGMNEFRKILVAEDDSDDYTFIAEALKKVTPTFEVERAKNGLECISYLKSEEKPDLIFLDLKMPTTSGLECLKFIKETDKIKQIPVVIYSTSHYMRDIDCAFKNEAHYYMVKPEDATALVEVLHTLFKRFHNSIERPFNHDFVLGIRATLN
jgi:CheY-like chemotaxis protein